MKSTVKFPDPRIPMVEGIVAVGGILDVGTLHTAYSLGIFPWPHEDYPMLWFCPDQRGVLAAENFKVPKSLKKFLNKNPDIRWELNSDFEKIIRSCSEQVRPGQEGTWITEEVIQAYMQLNKAGYVLSLAVYEKETLIGGIYGVLVQGVFSAESMFYRQPNASKIALWKVFEFLQTQGHEWIDVQMVTPVVASMGGKLLSRNQYLDCLKLRHLKS